VSNYNDFSSLIQKGKSLFMISHFETCPAAMYITKLNQNQKTGKLTAVETKNIDFSAFSGLWSPCAGSVTPWQTHLGSEEYPPDASTIDANGSIGEYYDAMVAYVKGDLKALNPYDYGWIPEIEILDEKGNVKVEKHYAMGRFSHELAYVMPDRKTVYLSDDGSNKIFYKFIADEVEDLSAGRLYGAKWIQTSAKGGGSANIKWIDLGHATDDEIKVALDSKKKFTDIFTVAHRKSDNTCPKGFTAANWAYKNECLQIKKGMTIIASRLESGRYASMMSVTSEFTKMEGITYNAKKNEMYMSLSRTEKGMEDYKYKNKPKRKYDKGGNNDIRLESRNHCGVVYKLSLEGYNVTSMTAMIQGTPMAKDVNGNTCKLDNISMPDNLTFIPRTNTLIIGEDTNYHQNDMVWAYQLESKKLTRILTAPYGAEMTSPYYYSDINGFDYLMSVVQHPYKESDTEKLENPDESRAYTGYIGPLPVIQ
jgi:secreted PhoX family phosphatase